MTKNKNVFLVLTEYQLLQAINIASQAFDRENVIYILRSGKRLMSINVDNVSCFANLRLAILENKSPEEIAKIILNEKPNHFLFFQGGFALNVFLAHSLSKKGVEISLGPDGYGPYAIFNKRFHSISVIRDSFKQNLYLFKNRLFSGKIHRFDYYRYGNHCFIDNLWITHPEQYLHKSKNNVNILKLPDFSDNCIDLIKNIFSFSNEFPTENVIYFFNQPLKNGIIETEYAFVKSVLDRFPEKLLIIKLHPLTKPETKLFYQQLSGVTVIESNVPAEVLLLTLNNCIVFTGWSAVLITENINCNYYFNYPIYKVLDDSNINQIDIVNLKHINMINSAGEMEFPHE